MHAISVAEARQIDQDAVNIFRMPSILLMENASRAVAEAARKMGDRFIILCGPGNNGGDGLAAARHLGRAAQVYLLKEPDPQRAPDAYLQLEILRAAGHPAHLGELPENQSGVWIDALLGTGLDRPVKGAVADWIAAFNAGQGPKLAVDIPSGLNGDTGEVLGIACRADRTVTFAAAKHGLLAEAAREYVGEVEVAGLGIPEQ
ncbi:MAG: NAD(P)H-hydrate epimerase [Planctomycetota bacterium]|jgi:NAD(P)H-hydrate epimerase